MSEKLQDAGLSGWRAVWKTLIALVWHFGNIAANGLWLRWTEDDTVWISTPLLFANFLLLAMAMGLDALAIARALGWGRGEKPPQKVQVVESPIARGDSGR